MPKALIVEIFGEAKQFAAELDKAAGKTRAFGAAAKVAAGVGVVALAEGVTHAFEAGEKLHVAQEALSTAIEHTGGNAHVLGSEFTKTAKAAAQFGVDQTTATTSLARALELTGNAAAAQRAYQEALVISKATGKDFNAVLTATAKGQEGITTSLQRYGIELAKGTPGQEQFNSVMARFGGQAEANTTSAQKLQANFSNLSANIGTLLVPAFSAIIDGLNSVVVWFESPQVSGAIKSFATGFMNAMQPIIAWVKQNWPEIKQIIVTTIQDTWAVLKGVFEVIQAGWREFGGTIKTIVHNDWNAIKGEVQGFVEVFKGVVDIVKGIAHGDWSLVWTGIKDVVGGAVTAIKALLEGLVRDTGAILAKLGSSAVTVLKDAFSAIGSAIAEALKAPVNLLIGALDAIDFGVHYGGLKILGHTVIPSVNFDWHPFHIPQLAEGGIVTSPTLAMIGEAGRPEAVVPLPSGGLGATINVNVSGWVGSDQQIAYKIRDELVRIGRREKGALGGFA